MASRAARVGRVAWKLSIAIFALIGLLVAGLLMGSWLFARGLGLYHDELIARSISPDGIYAARVVRTKQVFDEQTLVVLERADGAGQGKTVITYEIPQPIDVGLSWSDRDTIAVSLPCEPPGYLRPSYVDDSVSPSRRVIVDARPRDPRCRYRRGTDWSRQAPEK